MVEGFRRSASARHAQAARDARLADTACPWPVARAISPDAFLASRAPAYREMRRAAELAAHRGEGLVMAHAAFTARAGWSTH
jgi:nucleoside phosphorylase